jgi:hypothetical protein
MNVNLLSGTVWGAALAALLTLSADAAVNVPDAIELLRTTHKADRQVLVAQALQLSDKESSAFWPLYRSYRADMDKIGDGLVKLVLEYSDCYPNVPEESAKRLLKQYTGLEKELTAKRAWYLKRAGRALPATKVLRWAQLESRMDLVLRLQLAGAVPLVPAKPAASQ